MFWSGILSVFWVLKNKFYCATCIPFIYFYLSLDDAYNFHDRFSKDIFPELFYKILPLKLNLFQPIERIGEIFYWFLFLLFCIFISIQGFRSPNFYIKKFIKINFTIFFILSFFEIFIDTIYQFININSSFLNWFITGSLIYIEELGATICLAYACVRLFYLNVNKLN